MKNKMKLLGVAIGALVLATTGTVSAQDKPRSLDQLLRLVQQGKTSEARQNGKREAEFKQAKNRQAALLSQAKQTRVNEENRSARLEKNFEENEVSVATKQAALKEKLGSLTELFGHITSASGDLRANLETSLTSVQYPGREVFLDGLVEKMSGNDKLPSIEEIERLWFELQREAVETGRIVKFSTEVSKPNGDTSTTDVVRIGSFNIVSADGQYLKFDNLENKLKSQTTGANGIGKITAACDQAHVVQAFKMGYESNAETVPSSKKGEKSIRIALRPIDEIVEGDMVKLNPILFDFDKHNIKPQAAFELDKLVELMKKNPEMVIKVEGHTDNRGTDAYNLDLSERRARSTVQYVISKGIAKDRISGKGFGESKPAIDCGNNCTDEQYHKNRRSEFIIVKK